MRLLLATANEHKLRELAVLLEPHPIDRLPAGVDLGPEVGETFAANALAKARAAARSTGRAAVADDSGIEAEALGGRPGVYSRRYAGEDATDEENLAKLLDEAPAGSALAYVCAIAFVDPATGAERVFEGRCTGRLAGEPRGTGGFGYDPAFLADDGPPGLTVAELSPAAKHAISHRGRAARALLEWLDRGERLEQVDGGGDADGEEDPGVAVVAGEEAEEGDDERDEHGEEPGDSGDGHRAYSRG